MDDLDCTPEQKLKGAVSLLLDEAYQWWLTVKEGTLPDRLTWKVFKTTFQGKYVGASYVHARRREFLNLIQGDKSMAEYEAEFLRLSHYAHGIREPDFAVLVEKAKIAKDVKRIECQNREKDRARNKSVWEPSSSVLRPKKQARVDGPIRIRAPIVATGLQPYTDYKRCHQGKCWRRVRACFRCGSLEHHIKDCPRRPEQMQATSLGNVQPPRGVQQPLRGRVQTRGGNGMDRGQRAPGGGASHTEVR
ncbi:uncharacterized protein LOC128296645 [Gossypium arboreum]|uniref:uncharacterized protein LOC128296645 n=1 Tax=Gossypium arboreum TaxID=29729 RepID=UPI0022F17BC9|nr:uncharacterized protein LOC128296645 [Gossypium arboreum]